MQQGRTETLEIVGLFSQEENERKRRVGMGREGDLRRDRKFGGRRRHVKEEDG